jgi:hypothetical protein
MSILDTTLIAESALVGFRQSPIADLSSGAGEASIASLVKNLFPQLTSGNAKATIGRTAIGGSDRSIEWAEATNISGLTLGNQNCRQTHDCAYPGTGYWAVQLGEADMAGEDTRLFINIVDPFGAIILQLHGFATDRNFGDMLVHGADWEHQLRVYAFMGDFFGDVKRVLHAPQPVGDLDRMQALLGALAQTADTINDMNVDFMPVQSVPHAALNHDPHGQTENSVIRTLATVIAAYVRDFPIDALVGWRQPTGVRRDLGQDVARPFGDMANDHSLPKAPKGRVPPFSSRMLGDWFQIATQRDYRTIVECGRAFSG